MKTAMQWLTGVFGAAAMGTLANLTWGAAPWDAVMFGAVLAFALVCLMLAVALAAAVLSVSSAIYHVVHPAHSAKGPSPSPSSCPSSASW